MHSQPPARTTNMRGMKAGFTKPALRLEIDMNRGIWVGSTRATALTGGKDGPSRFRCERHGPSLLKADSPFFYVRASQRHGGQTGRRPASFPQTPCAVMSLVAIFELPKNSKCPVKGGSHGSRLTQEQRYLTPTASSAHGHAAAELRAGLHREPGWLCSAKDRASEERPCADLARRHMV